MKNTIIMQFKKSTKGTHVYENSETDSPVSSIYVKRSELPSQPPTDITLTIEYVDESNND